MNLVYIYRLGVMLYSELNFAMNRINKLQTSLTFRLSIPLSYITYCPEATDDVGEYNTEDNIKATFEYNTTQAKDYANVNYQSDLIGSAFVARDIKSMQVKLRRTQLEHTDINI
jgi:hypothetical protein